MLRSFAFGAAVLIGFPLVSLVHARASSKDVTLPEPASGIELAASPRLETAVFAGGCFWGIEAVFEHVKGVTDAVSGYAGGSVNHPSYEQVSSGATGHAESVRVTFDPSVVSYGQLVRVFFSVAHDPTQLNRQGPDHGPQYRSAIFYTSDEQRRDAEAYIAQLTKAKVFDKPIVTQIAPLRTFYAAEDYHQDFAAKNPHYPYILINDRPKVEHLKRRFPELYRNEVASR